MALDPNTFLLAAERIERDESSCCCYALFLIEQGTQHENYFCGWFRPDSGVDYLSRDYDPYWMQIGCTEDEARDRRVLALCLAATLLAAGETV